MRRTESGERAGSVFGRRVANLGLETGGNVRQGSERLPRALRAAIDAFRDSLQASQGADGALEEAGTRADEEELLEKKSPGARRSAAPH